MGVAVKPLLASDQGHVRWVKRRVTLGAATSALAMAAVLAVMLGGCSSGSASSSSSAPASQGGGAQGASKTCAYTPNGNGTAASLPPSTVDPAATYTATLKTNRGDIVIKLLNSQAPCTVNSFVHLANTAFWANTQCHRVSDDGGLYMLQCGDPTAKASATLTCDGTVGSGGPGYQFNDENLNGAAYPGGTVAMANAGPNTNGSQFFLVFQDTQLPPSYTPFGTITSGLDTLRTVAKDGTSCTFPGAGGGVPKDKVIIES